MPTILFVEDTTEQRDLLAMFLGMNGYHVEVANNGIEGLAQARKVRPDLILLDLGMPKMSGQRCLKELLDIKPDLKVVVASGYSLHGPAKGVIEAGARGYVSKPYQMAEMMTIVRDVLDGKSGFQATLYPDSRAGHDASA